MVLSRLLWVTLVQAQGIRLGEPSVVARAAGRHFLTEPSLAVHPGDPNHLLAVAIVEVADSSFEDRVRQQTCASFVSLDGGRNWARHDFSVTRCFDPWVAITLDGQAVVSVVGRHPQLAQQGDDLIVFHSADGGRTWDDRPMGLGRGDDHPTLVVDHGSREPKGWVYVLSGRTTRDEDRQRRMGIFVARSRDGGKTFDLPVRIVPNNLINLTEMPVVLSGGTLIVSFVDAARNLQTFRGDADRFDRRRAWVLRSTDGGRTFSIPLFVTDVCGPPPQFQLSALAADRSSSRFTDRLYFTCGGRAQGPVVLTHSDDGGEAWSDPVAVPPAQIDSSPTRVVGLAVNNQGVLGVARLDRVANSGDSCQVLSFTASLDGGETFLPPERVSTAPCDRFGDYFGMVTTPDGRFRIVWPEVRGGVSQLRTIIVQVEGHLVERQP